MWYDSFLRMCDSEQNRFTLDVSEQYALSVFRRPVYSWRFRTVCSVRLQKTGLLSTFRNSMLCPSSEDRFTLDVSEQYALSVIRRPVYPRHLGTVFSVPCPSSEDQFTLDVSEQYALSVLRRPVYLTFRNSMLCPSSEDRFTLNVSEQYALSVFRRLVYSRRFGTVCSVRLQKTF